jgi:exosortase/archaeosortase family protein
VDNKSTTSLPLPVVAATIGRREAFLWVVICLFANQALQLVDFGSRNAFAASLAQQNLIYWLACYAVIYRLYASDSASRANRFDCFLVLAICVSIFFASFLPYRFGIGVLATITAGYLLITHGGDRNLWAAGAVLLALSIHLVWAPILFQLFTPELLRADAGIVGGILKYLRPDIVWSDNSFHAPGGHSVSLIGGCSSFNNVSIAVLACATTAMLARTQWVRRDVATVAIACVVMILVNAVRICLLAWSGESHLFWHDGAGVQILGMAQTIVILLIAWWGVMPPRMPPRIPSRRVA